MAVAGDGINDAPPLMRADVGIALGSGIPLAATGLVYPVWAMAAMAASVTSLFINSLGGRPRLLLDAMGSVGRAQHQAK